MAIGYEEVGDVPRQGLQVSRSKHHDQFNRAAPNDLAKDGHTGNLRGMSRKLLECFPNPQPRRAYTIEHVSEEFTSVCPKTGHPDFGSVELVYEPGKLCIELKSLKLYYQSYRNKGIFYEAVTNQIADDLAGVMKPKWMIVRTQWKGRGGITSTIEIRFGKVPA
ncbi:MAG: NADPH-dependent 7-cyano-7-deazaguanine reductase QueF [Phycisphaerales bacterium]|nr:NADPH-dependent 7-cyano-7-deazaguanine reductase QueF [Phycisphaerales bacterium]